jgi:hypothetical protein
VANPNSSGSRRSVEFPGDGFREAA